jgi:AcrR family transcriptional regulator
VSPLTRRTEYAAEQRRRGEAALLAAAEALVAEGLPFSDLSVDAIAKQAGFSRATFYAYFTDKRALVMALGEGLAQALEEPAGGFLRDGSTSLRETLEGAVEIFAGHQGAVRALVETSTYDDEVAELWRGLHERFAALARERMRERHPELGRAAIKARAYVLMWSTERCITEHLAAPQVSGDSLLDALEIVWRVLLEEPAA